MTDPVPDLRRQPGPHVFVADLAAPELDDEDRHHLARSLRLRDGAPITISDAAGAWCTATFGPTIEVTGPVVTESERDPVTLAFALTKSGKPELVVQKATEIGVDEVILFHGDRSVPRWDQAKWTKVADRFARIAREAAMQSRQTSVPHIRLLDDLQAVVEHCGPGRLRRADFAAPGAAPAQETAPLQAISVGPEGGWSDEERSLVPAVVDLGATVLRAETAAIVAAARLTSRRQMR